MIKHFIPVLFVAAAVAATPASVHAEEIDREAAAEQIEQRLQKTVERLNLTGEQKAEVEAILRDSAEKRQVVLESYGFKNGERPKLRVRQMRSMRGELNEISEGTTRQLSTVLSDAQMAEYEIIKEEQKAAMRERIQSR